MDNMFNQPGNENEGRLSMADILEMLMSGGNGLPQGLDGSEDGPQIMVLGPNGPMSMPGGLGSLAGLLGGREAPFEGNALEEATRRMLAQSSDPTTLVYEEWGVTVEEIDAHIDDGIRQCPGCGDKNPNCHFGPLLAQRLKERGIEVDPNAAPPFHLQSVYGGPVDAPAPEGSHKFVKGEYPGWLVAELQEKAPEALQEPVLFVKYIGTPPEEPAATNPVDETATTD